MKKLSKQDRYFLKMLDAECKYRAATGGEDANEPFITPVLFSLMDMLKVFLVIHGVLLGTFLVLAAKL